MTIKTITINLALAIAFITCLPKALIAQQITDTTTISIPLGGNGWLTPNAKAVLNDDGLFTWADNKDSISVYVRPETTGRLNIALRLRSPDESCKISLNALDKTFIKTLSNSQFSIVNFGSVDVKQPAYIKITISGLSKKGIAFADITNVVISGTAIKAGAAYVKDNHGNFFYWGHRGPSVHLSYSVPAEVKNITEWFYNEVTVPVGQDIMGSYFMADGFNGGYFGMQVNDAQTRHILFSVWSPYKTDDPKTIPDNMKVHLLKKGSNIHGGEFGGEGSGGQSYVNYPWVAGKTYCFLMHAQGDIAAETTIYTAYFKPLDEPEWQLIASFKRPQSGSYLTGLHSFLENFDPAFGDKSRKVFFGNQWAVDIDGNWYQLNQALFTGDETASINYRKDYAGGVQGNLFYLRNGGFFSDFTPLKTSFTKEASGKAHPVIDFSKLP